MKKDQKIIYLYFMLLPFIDLLTSLTTRFTDFPVTIGMLTKGATLIFSLIYVFFISKSKYKKISIKYYVLLCIFGLIYIISKINYLNFQSIFLEISYAFKYFYFPTMLIGMINILDDYKFDNYYIKRIIIVTSFIYSFLMIIPYLTGTSFYSYYDYSHFKGSVGWFYAANEISSILVSLLISIYYFLDIDKKSKVFLIIPITFSLSIIGTKVGFLGLILLSIIYIYIFIKEEKFKGIGISVIALIIVFIMAALCPASGNFKNTINKHFNNDVENNINEGNNDKENTSNKSDKLNEFKYNDFYDIIPNKTLSKTISVLFNSRDQVFLRNYSIFSVSETKDKLFGLGWIDRKDINYTKDKLIEIDYFDILIHYGIIGFSVYFLPIIYLGICLVRNKKHINNESLLYTLNILIILGIALMAGHVFSAPSPSTYIILTIVYLINNIEKEKMSTNKNNDSLSNLTGEEYTKRITIMNLHLSVGGIEKYVSSLCKLLEDRYHIDLIITYKMSEEPAFNFNKNINIKYLINEGPNKAEIIYNIKNKHFFKLIKEVFKAMKILYLKRRKTINAIKNLNCDYVITTRLYETKLVNKLLKNSKIIKIATEHNFPTKKYQNNLIKATSNYDKLVVVNKEIEKIYYNEIGNKVTSISNFIDTLSDKIHNFKNKNLIAVGRFSREKGFDDLIDIMSIITKKEKSVKLTLIGDGEERTLIEEKIKKLKLEKNIRLTGYLDQKGIEKEMLKSSAYLMTSHTESFGLVILEAMNYGLPVVAFDSASGPKEILNECGTLIKNRNKEEFANKVIELINCNENKKKKMCIISKKIVSKYSAECIKEQYISLLNNLKNKTNKKLMFISSDGGHLSEMLMLKDMFNKYKFQIITEKSLSNICLKGKYGNNNVKFLIQSTPNQKFSYIFKLPINCLKSLFYYIKFKPHFIISTGAHTAGPMCCIGKIFGSKIIFIESFANSKTKTITGKIVYKFADLFIVQWEEMLELYPNAVYGGWIF